MQVAAPTAPAAPATWVNPEFSPASPPPPPSEPTSPLDGLAPAAPQPAPTDWSGLPAPAFRMADMGQPSAWSLPGGAAGLSEPNNKQPPRVNHPLPDVSGLPTLSPVARAAAQVAAPVTPAAPKADRMELAALELLLADPANQEMVKHFGGALKPLPTWTSVGQGIEARYGADLGARLYQLQNAQRAVEGEFFQAMDRAQQHPPAGQPPMARPGQPVPSSDLPGWRYQSGSGHWDGDGPSWTFDPGAFARHYAAGESAAQRAFAHLHGPDAVQFVRAPDREGAGPDQWVLGGLPLRQGRPLARDEGLTPEAFHAKDGWVTSGVWRPEHHLDPNRITKLNDKEMVWFDPVHGFSTDADNLKDSWLDRALPQFMGVAFGLMGAGVAGYALASAGTVAQGAAMGAAGSALNQFVSTGHVSFRQVLNSALAGGLSAGVMKLPGVGDRLSGPTSSAAGQLLQYTGRATLQGAIQAAVGGKFKDGFVNSLLSSVGSEITQHLEGQIAQMQQRGLGASEASGLRLLARATGSALRAVGGSGPAAGFASDFLGSLVGDAVQGQINGRAPAGSGQAEPISGQVPGNPQYEVNTGDDGLGLRPGRGEGMRWDDVRGQKPLGPESSDESRPQYDFDPEGNWDPDAPAPVNAINRPIAQLVAPVNPAITGGGIVGGGYQATRPAGAGGPPGYDPVYDLPSGAPGYRPGNPGLGIRVPPIETIVPPWIDTLIRGPALVGVTWAQYLMDRQASTILGNNLEAAGVVRPPDTDAHHIVAFSDPRAAGIRRMLEKWSIDINSPENGVFLPNKPGSTAPGSYHPRLNNNDYYRQINLDFHSISSRQDALDVLRNIHERLSNGTYPGSRPRPKN